MAKSYSHFEEQKVISELGEALNSIDRFIRDRESDMVSIRKQSPDAASLALDKLDSLKDKLENAYEMYGDSKAKMNEFMKKVQYAADLYDENRNHPSQKKGEKAFEAREQAEETKIKLDNYLEQTKIAVEKAKNSLEEANSRCKIAEIRAKAKKSREDSKKVRINFTLPENMKDDWKKLASDLKMSVSQMLRDSMSVYENQIKSFEGLKELEKLEELGDLGKWGDQFGEKMNKFGSKMDDIGNKIESKVESFIQDKIHPKSKKNFSPFTDKNLRKRSGLNNLEKQKLKKRIKGLVLLKKHLPISKLAQTLNQTKEQAENIIFELVADGIEGDLEDGIFKFNKNKIEDVIKSLEKIIDKM